MIHIPILRNGKAYESVDKIEILDHASGEPTALVSQANSGMISRDVHRMNCDVLSSFTIRQLIDASRKAGKHFLEAALPLGDDKQSFDDYIRQLSGTTGMPQVLCRANAQKIFRMFDEIEIVIAGLTRGFDLSILDRGYGDDDRRMLSYFREARVFGAVLPSNSPGVHSLWMPAIVLKTPVVLKPGREEPWSPLRIIEAFIAAGIPREAFGFYPTDHGGAAELLRVTDRSMLFGDASTTRPWANNRRVQLHGPGYSKVLLGDDVADRWEQYVELMVSSIVANGGRSCINASAIWTPRHADKIADAVGRELAKVRALPAHDPDAKLAAFANPKMAEGISATIDAGLREPGADEVTLKHRGIPRLQTIGRCSYLLPTIIRCSDREHPLANREFLFPYASVIECPTSEMHSAIGKTLIVTAITRDQRFIDSLMASENVDRLNIGAISTWKLSWDQPHEGNLFEHLYRQRSLQIETAA